MADIHSEDENTFIFNSILEAGWNGSAWMGMTDAAEEGNWVWTSGQPVTYTNWASQEPSNGNGIEHWMHMWGDDNPYWNDHRGELSTKCLIELPILASVIWNIGEEGLTASYPIATSSVEATLIVDGTEMCSVSQAIVLGQGCNDPVACNYSEGDSCNVSCFYALNGIDCESVNSSICGDGTVWDVASQTCIVANPADTNLDGCVQLNDLLDVLSAYGDCGAEEESSGFALSFDGVNDHVDFGNASLGNVEDVTFEVLMKTGSDSEGLGSNYQALLSKDCFGCEFSTGDWAILIGHNGNGVASFTINNSSGVAAVESGALNDEEWHWISVTRNATTGLVHLYVDGVEVDSDIGPVGLVHNEEKMYLAKYFLTNPKHYEGLVGELRVWNRELTGVEIGTYLGAELQGNESGLVGLWNFSEGEGDVLTDQTNGGLNGQIIEATWTSATETP